MNYIIKAMESGEEIKGKAYQRVDNPRNRSLGRLLTLVHLSECGHLLLSKQCF